MAKKGSKKTADKVPQTPNDVKPEVVSDMAKKGSKKTADKVPQTPNDVKPEVVSDEVETKIVNPVYQKFLNTLSSSEASVVSEQPLKGIPSFRKFLENLSDEELYELVK